MQYSASEFETLYIKCFPPSMRLALSLLHEEDEARDVVHDVFLKLWESNIKVENPSAYIIRSVRNASLSRVYKLDNHERIRRSLTLESQCEDVDSEERNEEVLLAISRLLTSREKQVVEKIYSEELTYNETASSLGISLSAVNKHIVSALKKLRTHFNTGKS